MYTAYFDASIRADGNYIGFVIISPRKRIVYARGSRIGDPTWNIVRLETLSLCECLRSIKQHHIGRITVCGDSNWTIDNVRRNRKTCNLIQSMPNVNLVWVRRNRNKIADRLCRDNIKKVGGRLDELFAEVH